MNICRFLCNGWFKSWILLESLKDRVDGCTGGIDGWIKEDEIQIYQFFDQIHAEHKFPDLTIFCRKQTVEIGSADVDLKVQEESINGVVREITDPPRFGRST